MAQKYRYFKHFDYDLLRSTGSHQYDMYGRDGWYPITLNPFTASMSEIDEEHAQRLAASLVPNGPSLTAPNVQ